MNQVFAFGVESYRGTETKKGVMGSSGSQETRARRRLLDDLHSKGWFVRKITLIESRPAH